MLNPAIDEPAASCRIVNRKSDAWFSPAAISLTCSTSSSTPVGHLPASTGQAVGALLQVGQTRLGAARLVQPHLTGRLCGDCERIVELAHGGVEGLSVLEPLQLTRQLVDPVQAAVVARVGDPLKLGAGGAAGGIGIADRIAVQRHQDGTYPGEEVLDGAEVHAHGVAELVEAVDELGGGLDVPHQPVTAVLRFH